LNLNLIHIHAGICNWWVSHYLQSIFNLILIKKIYHLTLLFLNFIVFAVLAHAVAETDVLTVAAVVNFGVHASVDNDLDVLNDADKLGLGSLLPGPGLGRKTPASKF